MIAVRTIDDIDAAIDQIVLQQRSMTDGLGALFCANSTPMCNATAMCNATPRSKPCIETNILHNRLQVIGMGQQSPFRDDTLKGKARACVAFELMVYSSGALGSSLSSAHTSRLLS